MTHGGAVGSVRFLREGAPKQLRDEANELWRRHRPGHEMGIRLALGTTPGRLRATLLGQTFLIVGLGAAIGVAIAMGFARYLHSLVQGADTAVAANAALAVAVTALVAAAAIWLATRHIGRLDVADVLRAECAE